MRRYFAAIAVLLAIGCAPSHPSVEGHPGRIVHIVVLWMKNPKDEVGKERIIEMSRTFKTVPGMVSVSAGKMNPSSTRPELDTTYDIAVVMTFKNSDAMDDYMNSPRHRSAVEKVLKPLVARQVVYDFAE